MAHIKRTEIKHKTKTQVHNNEGCTDPGLYREDNKHITTVYDGTIHLSNTHLIPLLAKPGVKHKPFCIAN